MTQDGLLTLYPKTAGTQVTLIDGSNAIDHINSDMHLRGSEREAFNALNSPGGFLKLDANGHVSNDFIDPGLLAIKTEFADINDMLTNGAKVIKGGIVMVNDATDDPNVQDGWAIYRRTLTSERYWELDKGWKCIAQNEQLDVTLTWEDINGAPTSTAEQIDSMAEHGHAHPNGLTAMEKLSEDEDGIHLVYDGHQIALDKEVATFHDTPYVLESNLKIGDIWLKESYAQSWWHNESIESSGESCYEMYMGYDTMDTAPYLRTAKCTNMTRMFSGCYDMETTQQYQTENVTSFTGMYYECTSLHTVPIMDTRSGQAFDSMFYSCINLKYSPEMILDNATNVVGMYSGCSIMEYVLPFGSTANINNMGRWFKDCGSLKKIFTPIDFSSITSDESVVEMFSGCIDLEEVEFVENTLKVSLSLENTNLTKECLLGILQGLPVLETPKTLTLTDIPCLAEISESEFIHATGKGWTIVR